MGNLFTLTINHGVEVIETDDYQVVIDRLKVNTSQHYFLEDRINGFSGVLENPESEIDIWEMICENEGQLEYDDFICKEMIWDNLN